MIDFTIEKILPVFLGLVMIFAILLLFSVPFIIYNDFESEKIELLKSEFECVNSNKKETISYIYTKSGNSGYMLPLATKREVCDLYARKATK